MKKVEKAVQSVETAASKNLVLWAVLRKSTYDALGVVRWCQFDINFRSA